MRKKTTVDFPSRGKHRNLFLAFYLTLIMLFACISQVFAQKTVSGKVTDKNGLPLPGVAVIVKGTTLGNVTNADGTYTITGIPAGSTLKFSFVGLQPQEFEVGSKSTINVSLAEEAVGLEEVVVTALGIKKESKSLGYATSNISSDQLSVNRTPNMMNALEGKIAGVSISSLGTGPNGTSKTGYGASLRFPDKIIR
jgi:hypothetical protein